MVAFLMGLQGVCEEYSPVVTAVKTPLTLFPELSRCNTQSAQWKKAISFLLDMVQCAAEYKEQTGHRVLEQLLSDFSLSFSRYDEEDRTEFLLDLYSLGKEYETQTGKEVLQTLLPVYQSFPKTWSMDLTKRKASLFLEIFTFSNVKRPVELRNWITEESELRSLLECLQYISELRFPELSRCNTQSAQWKKAISFLLDMVQCAAEYKEQTGHRVLEQLLSDFSLSFSRYDEEDRTEFLLDLYSLGKEYETQTGKEVLQTLLPVYQSFPKTWSMDLTKRKASLFLEIFTFSNVKRPVELRNWITEESELRSLLECLQYISELRFPELSRCNTQSAQWKKAISFLLDMVQCAAEYKEQTGHRVLEQLLSDFSLSFSRYDEEDRTEFLLDLYSLGKEYETQTGKEVLQTLLPVYQSFPKTWSMDLTKRKASLFPEIFTSSNVKRPVELRNWITEESELRSLLECLQYISELRFPILYWWNAQSAECKQKAISFLLDMMQRAAEYKEQTGHRVLELLLSAFSLCLDDEDLGDQNEAQSEFLLDLYSLGKEYETQTGKEVLQTLLPVYQSFPKTWSMDLTKRKASLFLEIFAFYKVKRPVELRNWTTEESELRGLLECLQYISELSTNKQTKPASSPQRQRVEATRGRSTSGKSTAQLEAERRNYIFNYIFNIWSCFIWSCFNQKHCSLKPCSCVYFSDNKLKLGAADSNPAVFWDTGEGRSPQHKQTNKASQHSQRLRVEATRGRSTSGKSTAQLEAERRNYIFNIWSCFIWSCFNQKHCSLKPCSCVYFSDNKLKLGAADSNPAVFWDTGEGRSPQHKQTKPASIHSDGVWKRRVGEVRVEKVQRS
ncbi:UNVERIFIED_CONTAM: hypothetical protein FKN15_060504 [Acipenser sinensis]